MVHQGMIVVLLIFICFGSLTQVSTEVNLALKKDVSMSSIERPDSEEFTVNGNRAQTMASGSCSSTKVDAFDVEAWWRVDLGEVYSITGVKIYYRDEDTLYRFSGFQVFITKTPDITSSTPCYKDNDGVQGEPFPTSIVSLLNCTGEGRFITIYKIRESGMCTSRTTNVDYCSILEICEVEVYGGNTCVNCKSNSDCDSSSGTCTGGCIAGYTGVRCTEECPEGSYGDECNGKCGHCLQNTKCEHVNGTCPQGCADGWKGTLCDRECEDGRYGPGCSLTCSCGGDFLCNHVNGECSPKRCEARKSLPFAMEIYMKNHIPSAVKPGHRQSSRDDLEKCKMLCLALNFCKLIAVKHAEKGSDCKIYDDASHSDSFTSSTDYDVYLKVEY